MNALRIPSPKPNTEGTVVSTSDLYIIYGKSVSHLAEFRNGYGSAPICWDYIGGKYLPEKPAYSMDHNYLKKVWALADSGRLTEDERTCMMMTFDRSFLQLADLKGAAIACEVFGKKVEDGRRENHWPAFAEALRDAATMKHNRHARGVALSCTSVCDPWGSENPEQLANAWPIVMQSQPRKSA